MDMKVRPPREVKGVISAREVTMMMMPSPGAVEVRERSDGHWTVWYPDPGFLPCIPGCATNHKHDYTRSLIKTNYEPTDYADAVEWANSLAEGGEVKIMPFQRGSAKDSAS